MAKPIKETPILRGNDAVRFIQEKNASKGTVVDKDTRNRIRANYEKLNAIAEF